MNRFRMYVVASFICIGAIFISASLTYALTRQQKKDVEACEEVLIQCWNDCDYAAKRGITNQNLCDSACENNFGLCLKEHGVIENRPLPPRPPKRNVPAGTTGVTGGSSGAPLDKGTPTRKPNKFTPQTGKGGVTGNDAGSTKPGATTAPVSKKKAGHSRKPKPTATPEKKS